PSSMAPIGGFLVTELLKQVAADQLPLFTDVKVDELVVEAGKISGVKATTPDGAVTITAGAVLLATGGFGANKTLLGQYRDDLKNYQTTNQP
ncbi:FAD-binding protein, partial [Klebsiella pneumoniae]|nr:FAD-binding protein [Klebsiella pneumoniae]